ncbi:MAG: hypothetical protein RDU76_11550 [Candidatus Edwardsbacteria bacterium]|nr:hypothetical protein [Candidatus Edwardsbacteria bacterium]
MGQLGSLRAVHQVLTTLARGYTNAQLVAEELFPIAPVDKEAVYIPVFGKDAFKNRSTERAIRAASNRINPDSRSNVAAVLVEHDLEYPIDVREEQESDFSEQEHAAMVVTEAIKLRLEKLAAILATTAGSYAAGSRVTLSGSSQFSHADCDPVTVFETGKEAIRTLTGKYPNKAVLGATTFAALKSNPALLERIKYSMKGVLTVELLQEILGIPKIVVGAAVSSNDAGTAMSDVWSDVAVLAFVPNGSMQSIYEPSYGYTLRKRGYPQVDQYTENGGKLQIVRCTDILLPKIVGADAGYLISDTCAPVAGL